MDTLLQRQAEILDAVKQIERNFKKDPSSRKTRQYLDAKLESIDKLCSEFNSNDNKLEAFRDDSPYFAEEQYDRAKEYYAKVRFMIASHQAVPSLQHKPVVCSQDAELKATPSVSTGGDATGRAGTPSPLRAPAPRDAHQQLAPAPALQSELEELLSQQRTNFRALSRQIQAVNLNTIIDKWELEEELRNLQTRWDTVDKLHLKIDHISQGSNTQYENEFSYNETIYKNMRRSIYQKLSATSHLQQSTPKIDIPVFTGKYIQWPTFFDLFNETIHNNNFLSKCQKMQHLKGKLKGEAERLIQHLNISADNYDTAWDLLTRRYNNTQLLFTKNLETFLNQPTVQKQTAYEIKRLYDTSMECIHAIQNLGVNISSWDPILVHLICKKLDPVSYNDYKEARKSPRDLPLLNELMNFLEGKFTALEEISKKDLTYVYKSNLNKNQSPANESSNINQSRSSNRNGKFQTNTTRVWNCPFCKQKHNLFKCNKFAQLGPDAKLKTVKKLDICANCLFSHDGNACNSNKLCKICYGKHNSILHDSFASYSAPPLTAAASNLMHASPSAPAPNKLLTPVADGHHNVNYVSKDDEEILLTTLLVKVKAADGSYITLRALLDQGSQISLISENAAQWLGLPRSRYHASISGIGYGSKQSKGVLNLSCQSIYDDYVFETQALVINHVINNLPNVSFAKQTWEHLQHIQLADPHYNISKPIDLLLDASVYSEILMSGLVKGPGKAPIAQQTRLGWILSGNVKTFNCSVVINNLSEISNYWEFEEINECAADMTESEKYCEQLYKNTTKRLESGRYEVALPMKPNFEQNLGKSKNKAIAQFINLEKKLASNEQFSQSYKQFMNEYLSLGHMKPVDNSQQGLSCYLPHHGVIKADSTTTKLRTVFNASSKTSSGNSLNDLMERGPNLQKDLHSLILIWRQHKYVITADIEKMFRQILVNESAQHLQRVVWRESRGDPLREYQLTTITYGTKAAPYLAMRTLRQLADDDAQIYPIAAAALKNSFYMDDLLEGCSSLEQAKELQQQLINILMRAGMKIRKWSSNDPALIQNLSPEDVDSSLDFRCAESRKTLGLRWNPKYDTFSFKNIFYDINDDTHITKRQLLSHISKVFDPVGWLAPLTIRAKLLFQKTWSDDCMTWDQRLPHHLVEEWQQLKQDLQNIEIFEIPRYFGESDKINLYAFCDSSEKAYACAIFVSTRNAKGEYTTMLLTAKTKLAPIKNKLTLPKLELCSALLLSRLITKVRQALNNKINKIHAFTDSMIVLGWIYGDTNRWKQFVATRIKRITDVIPSTCWHHVESKQNSADCATRGMTAAQLKGHYLWWEGPEWLREYDSKKIKSECYSSPDIEVKENITKFSVYAALNENNAFIFQLINECSSLRRAAVNLGWLSRYIVSLRNKQSVPRLSYLTSSEMQRSYDVIIRTIQKYEFEEDYQRLINNKNISRNSKLSSLCPYIDKNDKLMRVRGRLNNSLLSSSAKHPIILPSHSRLTNLIISEAHTLTLHGGPRLTLSFIREKYWIISGLRTVKRELRKCVKCRRFSEQKSQQLMADLPQPRVTPSRPFTHTGVDFTGHFDIKINKGRGVKTSKGYVAVFVCFSTKAVHLELVSDLSTPGFLAAFRRFCARRGCPRRVYSDNGTNFVGANRLLKREYEQIQKTINQDFFRNIYNYNIEWVFNAPGNPEAGGLWEGAVKRMKYHLKRVVGEQKLTYEEFITVLHQIEACLNSRPLVGLTENAEDVYLTPGHFLVGGSLLSRPQTDPEHISLTTRWKMIQSMNKQFWRRWSAEYLQELQSRSKWRKTTKNLELDDIVVIKEENLPPGKWALGRIVETHPGKDGYVRVVSVKTKNGVIKRPIIKLVPLPVKEETKAMMLSPDD
ncbi:uncharacterized protein LOC123657418 [Melitaea cinxia]|uniref:uncharacterized protein LOC123657418 n=1 Tax=Melitaea cinxia TaxID=113334 RepID=UPI001E271065|nr:uncharacterized protein LOC123657418 [Melitaea cinxia]